MRLGCSTIVFGGFSLEQALTSIKAAGYDAIELAAIPSMADHLPVDASDADYRAIGQRVVDAGLAIESIGGSTNLLDPASRSRFTALLRAASLLGAPAVTTALPPKAGAGLLDAGRVRDLPHRQTRRRLRSFDLQAPDVRERRFPQI